MDRELPGVFGLAFKKRKDIVKGDNVLVIDAHCMKESNSFNGRPVVAGMALTVMDGAEIKNTESINGHEWVTILVQI